MIFSTSGTKKAPVLFQVLHWQCIGLQLEYETVGLLTANILQVSYTLWYFAKMLPLETPSLWWFNAPPQTREPCPWLMQWWRLLYKQTYLGPIRRGRGAVHAITVTLYRQGRFRASDDNIRRYTLRSHLTKVITAVLMACIFTTYALIFPSVLLWSLHTVITVEAQCKWVSPASRITN